MALSVIIVLYVCVGILQQKDPFPSRRNYSRQKQNRSFLLCFSLRSRHFTSRSPPISRTKKHGDSKRWLWFCLLFSGLSVSGYHPYSSSVTSCMAFGMCFMSFMLLAERTSSERTD